jgi:glycine/D-amino acid oxidase-like deaminating enzyme
MTLDSTLEFEHAATWYAQTVAQPRQWPALTFEIEADVCVVGGGLAGLTAALEIARRGWSAVVLEAKRIAWNASGRNVGFVLPGFGQDIERVVDRCGLDHTKVLWALSEDGVEYVRNLINDTGMPGVEPVDGWLDVSKVDNGDELLSFAALLGQEFGVEVEGWPLSKVRSVLRSDHYFHALYFPKAFHIHPLNYALGLAAAAEAAGVRIFENTPALEIDPAGVRKRVVTPQARVRTNHIVLAGNSHLGGVAPDLAETVLPLTTYVAVTEPLGDRLAEAVTFAGAVSDTRRADYHYRVVGGDRLMWSGGCTTAEFDPASAARRLHQAMLRTYPDLGPIEIAHAWPGTMGFSVHRMPQIGEVQPGLWIASAFGGHGINTTAMAGGLIARAVVENDDAWRLFLPYDLVWAGGTLGRVAAKVQYWSYRSREHLEAKAARRREAVRLQDESIGEVPSDDEGSGAPASERASANSGAWWPNRRIVSLPPVGEAAKALWLNRIGKPAGKAKDSARSDVNPPQGDSNITP